MAINTKMLLSPIWNDAAPQGARKHKTTWLNMTSVICELIKDNRPWKQVSEVKEGEMEGVKEQKQEKAFLSWCFILMLLGNSKNG